MDPLGSPVAAPGRRLSPAAQAIGLVGALVLASALAAVPYLESGVAVERLLSSPEEPAPSLPQLLLTADDRRDPLSPPAPTPLGPPVSTTSVSSLQLVAGPVDATAGVERAMTAYRAAADTVAAEDSGCRLSWTLLAGIGQVESGHGTVQGSGLDGEGKAVPPILGPALNGNGFALITDSDGGVFDGDLLLDRAVGPMQFIPTTWARWGADADGDGVRDPQDVDDATLAAGRYLCASGGPLDTPAGLARAVFSYNRSYDYVRLVLTLTAGYLGVDPAALGVDSLPAPAPAVEDPAPVLAAAEPAPAPAEPAPADPAPAADGEQPGSSPAPTAATPTPSPDEQPVPVPEPGAPSPSPAPGGTPPPSPTPSACRTDPAEPEVEPDLLCLPAAPASASPSPS